MSRSLALAAAAGLLAASPALAQGCEGTPGAGMAKLTVEATGVRNAAGEVAFTLYPDIKRRFLAKGGKLLRVRVPARPPSTTACFWVRPGFYAVAQYHDENRDHDFNHTLWLPKEGYGFSNDAPTSIGLPSFASARFQVAAGGANIRMAMRYPR